MTEFFLNEVIVAFFYKTTRENRILEPKPIFKAVISRVIRLFVSGWIRDSYNICVVILC